MPASSTTIIAPATAAGSSAIAVVRLSGPQALAIAGGLCDPPREPQAWQPRQASLVTLCDKSGVLIDQALALPFVAPNSYTGEDAIELHLHGNPVIVAHVLEAAIAAGAVAADAGAFTRRAVLNGKLGLPEAESLAELIDATSKLGAAQALARLKGGLRDWAEGLRSELVAVLAQLEAYVDFPDEPIEPASLASLAGRIDTLATSATQQADGAAAARVWVNGARIVIAGPPNAGKSTLLNRLLGEERALVSPWAGTTRDYLEAGTYLEGLPIRLIDTAGIRETDDAVEQMGIDRTHDQIADADLVLQLQAPDATVAPPAATTGDEPRVLPVWNKADLEPGPPGMVAVSAADGAGIDELVAAILAHLQPPPEPPMINSIRQEHACREAVVALQQATVHLGEGFPPEIAAEDLRQACSALDALLGVFDPEEILDELFSSFCIGK